jgi:hypothetical protein
MELILSISKPLLPIPTSNIEMYGTIRLDKYKPYKLYGTHISRNDTLSQFFTDVSQAKTLEHLTAKGWTSDTEVKTNKTGENVYISGLGQDIVCTTLDQLKRAAKIAKAKKIW